MEIQRLLVQILNWRNYAIGDVTQCQQGSLQLCPESGSSTLNSENETKNAFPLSSSYSRGIEAMHKTTKKVKIHLQLYEDVLIRI